MSPSNTGHIWYVAYGSNLLEARLLAYLTGCGESQLWGTHRGSVDPTPPSGNRRVGVPHPVFFGGHSSRWGGGCCFCPNEALPDGRLTPVGRAWRVTWEQMADLAAQENGRPTEETFLPDQPPAPGKSLRVLDGGIDLLIGMETIEGEPACTLGSSAPPQPGPPSSSYRSVLAEGMAEMGLTPHEIKRHLDDLERPI